jgi:hypothetical protein
VRVSPQLKTIVLLRLCITADMARSLALWCLAVVVVAAGGASAAFAPLTVDQLPYETTAFEPSIDNMTMVSKLAWGEAACTGYGGRPPSRLFCLCRPTSHLRWLQVTGGAFHLLILTFPACPPCRSSTGSGKLAGRRCAGAPATQLPAAARLPCVGVGLGREEAVAVERCTPRLDS